jgi:hypothetical protein
VFIDGSLLPQINNGRLTKIENGELILVPEITAAMIQVRLSVMTLRTQVLLSSCKFDARKNLQRRKSRTCQSTAKIYRLQQITLFHPTHLLYTNFTQPMLFSRRLTQTHSICYSSPLNCCTRNSHFIAALLDICPLKGNSCSPWSNHHFYASSCPALYK